MNTISGGEGLPITSDLMILQKEEEAANEAKASVAKLNSSDQRITNLQLNEAFAQLKSSGDNEAVLTPSKIKAMARDVEAGSGKGGQEPLPSASVKRVSDVGLDLLIPKITGKSSPDFNPEVELKAESEALPTIPEEGKEINEGNKNQQNVESSTPTSDRIERFEVSEFFPNLNSQLPESPNSAATGIPPVEELEKIRGTAANKAIDENASSQQILADMIKECKALGYTTFESKADLGGESTGGRYEIKPYTMDSSPGKTFYQIKVKYELTAQAPADKDWPPENFEFERTIYTTATNPEDAIRLAMQFKQTVIEYAIKDESTFNEFDTFAMSSRSFTFDFSRNASGTMTHLNSIQAYSGIGGNQEKMERKETPPSSTEKYFFNKDSTGVEKLEEGHTPPGSLVFDSKEVAEIYQKGFSVVDQDYNDLIEKGIEKDYALNLQQEIKKGQQKFEELAKEFIKKPGVLSRFGKGGAEPSFSDEFNALALSLKQSENGGDTDNQSKLSSFTDKIVQLHRINCELKAKQGQLKSLEAGAKDVQNDDHKKQKAETFVKLLSQVLPILGEKIHSNDQLMNRISDQLSGVKGTTTQLRATDYQEEEE